MPCAPHPLLTLSPAVRHEVRVVTVGPRRAAFGGADGPLILHVPSFFRPRGPSDAVTPIVMHPPITVWVHDRLPVPTLRYGLALLARTFKIAVEKIRSNRGKIWLAHTRYPGKRCVTGLRLSHGPAPLHYTTVQPQAEAFRIQHSSREFKMGHVFLSSNESYVFPFCGHSNCGLVTCSPGTALCDWSNPGRTRGPAVGRVR